jgi:HPt (histidine-containing phosphotransfer) domain-containing protein
MYSLVLMDCNMPVMDGHIATQTIREMELFGEIKHTGTFKYIPVIALTANVIPGIRKKCIDSGMNDYLSKPVDITMLEKYIDHYIGNDSTEIKSCPAKKIEPVSLETLGEYKELTGDKFYELANTFIKDTSSKFSELREAIPGNDLDVVIMISHTLAGSYGFMGANKASSLCKELETDARASKLENVLEQIDNIEQEHQVFILILKKHL